MLSKLKALFDKWNNLGEPERYNRGEFNYGYKTVVEFIVDGVNLPMCTITGVVSLLPFVGLVVPFAFFVNSAHDSHFNIGKAAGRLSIATLITSVTSTLITWMVFM